MDFTGALEVVKHGGRVYRRVWENKDIFVSLHVGTLTIKMQDRLFHPWTIMESDMHADDWQTVADA